ncbi:hypothetical protein LXL04_011736 [Taraxacum kok-saghyz]
MFRYVDVILQLINKAGDFVSDDIWFRVVRFITNNEDLQPYAALKAREYLDNPAVHETMVKDTNNIHSSLNICKDCNALTTTRSIITKLDLGNIHQVNTTKSCGVFCINRKGAGLMGILAELPKFPERESSLIKKAKNTKTNTTELGAIKLRTQQQQDSNALVVTDQHPVNEPPQLTQLPMVKIPTTDNNSVEQELTTQANGTSRELINIIYSYINIVLMSLQPIGDIAERFNALCVKDSGVLYEDPYAHIGIKADWRAHQGRVIIFLGNKTTSSLASVQEVILPPSHLKLELSSVPEIIPPRAQVENKLRILVVINKFFQPIPVSIDEFFPHWRLLAGPPLKLQEVVRERCKKNVYRRNGKFDQ